MEPQARQNYVWAEPQQYSTQYHSTHTSHYLSNDFLEENIGLRALDTHTYVDISYRSTLSSNSIPFGKRCLVSSITCLVAFCSLRLP